MDQQSTQKEEYEFNVDGYPCPNLHFILIIRIPGEREGRLVPAVMNQYYSTEVTENFTERITVFDNSDGKAKSLTDYIEPELRHNTHPDRIWYGYKKLKDTLRVYKTSTKFI